MNLLTSWVDSAPLAVLGAVGLGLMVLAVIGGAKLRERHDRFKAAANDVEVGQETYVVSAVLGLLALLLGFTFALAVDRYETRRALVVEEANAIGTAYLRSQLLGEPHRTRLSRLLVEYTDNRLVLAEAGPGRNAPFLKENDRLITELWAATASAFATIKDLDFSSAYVDSMNALIDLDTARKAARMVHVPTEVFVVLIIYIVVTAAVLGYVLVGRRGRGSAAIMLALLGMSFLLIIDVDRPTRGGIRETQAPMEQLRDSLKAQPPAVFDHWHLLDAKASSPQSK